MCKINFFQNVCGENTVRSFEKETISSLFLSEISIKFLIERERNDAQSHNIIHGDKLWSKESHEQYEPIVSRI